MIVLEARPRLGGRAWFAPFPAAERSVEMGGAWISRKLQPRIAREVERYRISIHKVDSNVRPDQRWSFGRDDYATTVGFTDDERYELEHALFDIMAAAHRIDSDRPYNLQELDDLDISVDEFVRARCPSVRVREFLFAHAGLYSGAEPHKWSALHAISRINNKRFSTYASYHAVEETFVHGTAELVDALVTDTNAEIRTNAIVQSIRQDETVRLATADGQTFEGATTVVAVPLNVMARLTITPPLSEAKRDVFAAGHAGRMRKVWVLAENAPRHLAAMGWEKRFVKISSAFECPTGTLLVGMSCAPTLIEAEDEDAIRSCLTEVAPSAHVVATRSHDWESDPFSRGTWASHRPGVLSKFHSELLRSEGRIVFAGADFATRWSGHMDGAVESGTRAALEAVALAS